MAADVHAEDRVRGGARLLGGARQLDAAGLAAPAGVDLRLDRDQPAEALGNPRRLVRRRRHLTGVDRDAVPARISAA